jgi:hypothetical protein
MCSETVTIVSTERSTCIVTTSGFPMQGDNSGDEHSMIVDLTIGV